MNTQITNKTVEILIADDNPEDVRLAMEGLKDSGRPHHVTVVQDGAEAMAALSAAGPHASTPIPSLILLDLNLPKKNGREILAEIKENADLKHIPIVVWSTSPAASDIHEAYRLLANCYVVKPVGLDRSMEVVRKIVEFWLGAAELPDT